MRRFVPTSRIAFTSLYRNPALFRSMLLCQPRFAFYTQHQMRMFSTQGQLDHIKEMKTEKDFEDVLSNPDKATVIQAGASWCNPCQVLKPKLVEAVKKQNGAINFLYIDIDAHQGIAQMLQVN